MKRCVILLLWLCYTASAYAVVFQQVGPAGQVIFSDRPMSPDAKVIRDQSASPRTPATEQAKTATNNTPTANTTVAEENEVAVAAPKPYTRFKIMSPEDGESIQNQPIVYVIFDIDPPLQTGDMIQVYLDAKAWGPPLATTHFSFTAPDRGTHFLYGVLLDKNKRTLKQSPRITVYVHQAHIPTQPPRPNNAM